MKEFWPISRLLGGITRAATRVVSSKPSATARAQEKSALTIRIPRRRSSLLLSNESAGTVCKLVTVSILLAIHDFMAILEKHIDREDWLRWAIAFMQLGLWLDVEFEVHGPHYPSGRMWGKVLARVDSTGENVPCVFLAKAHRSKYDPVDIRVFMGDVNEPVETDRFPLVKASQLTPRARRWLRGAQRTANKLRRERQAAW